MINLRSASALLRDRAHPIFARRRARSLGRGNPAGRSSSLDLCDQTLLGM